MIIDRKVREPCTSSPGFTRAPVDRTGGNMTIDNKVGEPHFLQALPKLLQTELEAARSYTGRYLGTTSSTGFNVGELSTVLENLHTNMITFLFEVMYCKLCFAK